MAIVFASGTVDYEFDSRSNKIKDHTVTFVASSLNDTL